MLILVWFCALFILLLRIFHLQKAILNYPWVIFLKGFIALTESLLSTPSKGCICVERLIKLPHPGDCLDIPSGDEARGSFTSAVFSLVSEG